MNTHKDKLSPVTRVSLDAIVTDGRFQTRRVNALYGSQKANAKQQSTKHIIELANELLKLTETVDNPARHAHLKPLIVWQPKGVDVYHIVSGFHRHMAYHYFNRKLAPNKRQRKKTVPVQIFTGDQEEALLLSARQDIRPNIPKTPEQRANTAWELVRTANKAAQALTAQQLALQTGTSSRTVERMRQTYKALSQKGSIIYENWKVQCLAMRNNVPSKSEEEMRLAKLTSMKKQIFSRYLRDGLSGDAEMFTQLLKMISSDLKQRTELLNQDLQDELQEILSDDTYGEDPEEERPEVDLKEFIEFTLLSVTMAVIETSAKDHFRPELTRLAAILTLKQSQQESVVIETLIDLIDLAD